MISKKQEVWNSFFLYQGNQVRITTNDGGILTGIMVSGRSDDEIEVKSDKGTSIICKSDIEDIQYVGKLTDYHTMGESATIDDVIEFCLSDIVDDKLFEKMRYKEFACTICCHLRIDEENSKIGAYDVALKDAVHVIHPNVLNNEYLFKLYGSSSWKLGTLTEAEEGYALTDRDASVMYVNASDIADITMAPKVNDTISVMVDEGKTYTGIVNAVWGDRVFVVQKIEGKFVSQMVMLEDIVSVRYHGKVTAYNERFSIDKKYFFKNPFYLRDNTKSAVVGRKASFVAGINERGTLIAKDVIVDREVGKVYTGIVLYVNWKSIENATGYIGKRYGRINEFQGDVEFDRETLKRALGDRRVDINKQYCVVQYTVRDENPRGKLQVASIEDCIICEYGKYDATIEVFDTPLGEEIRKEVTPLMLEKKERYEGKFVEIKCISQDENGQPQVYAGVYKASEKAGAVLENCDEIIPWEMIQEVRIYGKITSFAVSSEEGIIDGERFFKNSWQGFQPKVNMPVWYELAIAKDRKGLRCVGIRSLERKQLVYIVGQEKNIYSYIEKEEYMNGNKDEVKTLVSDCVCFIPAIEKNDYPAEFMWRRENGIEVLKEINLIQGAIPKENLQVPEKEGSELKENSQIQGKEEEFERRVVKAKEIPVAARAGWIKLNTIATNSLTIMDDQNREKKYYPPKFILENFLRMNGVKPEEFELNFNRFEYKIAYTTKTVANKTGKKKLHISIFSLEEVEKSPLDIEIGNMSTTNGIVGTVEKCLEVPAYVVGENVFVVCDTDETEKLIYGVVSRIEDGHVYMKGEGLTETVEEVEIDQEHDKVYRFGLLTKVNEELTTACMSNCTSFSYDAMDKAAQGVVKTLKKRRMLAYLAKDNQIVEVTRPGNNSDNILAGIRKEDSSKYRGADFIYWQPGKVLSYNQDEREAVVELEDEQQVTAYVTQDVSHLISSCKGEDALVGKEVYVKVVSYPCKQDGEMKVVRDAIEMYMKEDELKVTYSQSRERWEAYIHDTFQIEVTFERDYLKKKNAEARVCFEISESNRGLLYAVVKESKTPLLDTPLGHFLAGSGQKKYWAKEKKLYDRLIKRINVLKNVELEGEDEKRSREEYLYLLSVLASGKEKPELYKYQFFLGDFYQGDVLADMYAQSLEAEFDADEALRNLFVQEKCCNALEFVSHIITLDDKNFEWIVQDGTLLENEKLSRFIFNELKGEPFFDKEKVELDNLYAPLRDDYQRQLAILMNDLENAEDCKAVAECLDEYLVENIEIIFPYTVGEYELGRLSKIRKWCYAASNGFSNKEDYRKQVGYLRELEELEQIHKGSQTRLLTEMIFTPVMKNGKESISECLKAELTKNVEVYLERRDPVISCGIPGNEIVVGQEQLDFYVQNYSENCDVLRDANNIEIILQIVAKDENGKEVEVEGLVSSQLDRIRKLAGMKEEGNCKVIPVQLKLDYAKYGVGTELIIRADISYYDAANTAEKREISIDTHVMVCNKICVEAKSPYPEDGVVDRNVFFGRVKDSKRIQENILSKIEKDGKSIYKINPGKKVFLYGQKQCGKTSLITQFLEENTHKILCEGNAVEDSAVLVFVDINADLEKSKPQELSKMERIVYYGKQIRCLVMKMIKENLLVEPKEENVSAEYDDLDALFSDCLMEETSEEGENVGRITIPADEKYAVLKAEVPNWRKLQDTDFDAFIDAFKDLTKLNLVVIMDEFTNYCEQLMKLPDEYKERGFEFMHDFEKKGFVQVFIGHESMYELIDSMGKINKTLVKGTTMRIEELETEEAKEMIQKPIVDILKYNPYKTVLGEQAIEELLRLSGCNPKILNSLCNVMYAYMKNLFNNENRKFLTKKDVEVAVNESVRYSSPEMKEILFEALLKENKDSKEMTNAVKDCLRYILRNPKRKKRYLEPRMIAGKVWVDGEQKDCTIDLYERLINRGVIVNKNGYLRVKVGWFADYIMNS